MVVFEEIIAKYLESQGFGTYGGKVSWTSSEFGISDFSMPEAVKEGNVIKKPINMITVYNVKGKPINTLIGFSGSNFIVQIRVRASTHSLAKTKLLEIYDLLKYKREISQDGAILQNIQSTTDIMTLGLDKNSYFIMAANFSGHYINT